MNAILKRALALAGLSIATQAAAQITFYEHPNFGGRTFTADQPIFNLERPGYSNRASSAVVRSEAWEICDGPGFTGKCVILPPGNYPVLGTFGMNDSVSSIRPEAARSARVEPPVAPPGPPQITLYSRENFDGRAVTVDRTIGDLDRIDFDQRASSAIVQGGSWEICDDVRFGGRCLILRPGQYPSLAAAGMDNRISSVRRVEDGRADARYRRY